MERFFLELEPPAEVMASWPHVVVVGAGPAGCELAGSLIELMQRAAGLNPASAGPKGDH